MSTETRVFITIYALCVVAWIAILPCVQMGMGARKPNHDLWKRRTDFMMIAVIVVTVLTGFTQAMLALWS